MANTTGEWRSFTAQQLKAIEDTREEVKKKGREALRPDPKGTYGIICRACTKPNAPTATFCTGCSFPAVEWDLQRLPDNVFLDLVNGKDVGAKVHYRDDDFVVFDDKFGVSTNHLDIIPTKVFEDITSLRAEHIPMLERMYELGKKELLRRNIPFVELFQKDSSNFSFDDFIVSGYNFPVSVKHLHLHMVCPPFSHEKVFQYPRWHPHHKVIKDLKTFGRVKTYSETPDEDEGKASYAIAMERHRAVLKAGL